jgi:GDPmannose 4,6-dehydratase
MHLIDINDKSSIEKLIKELQPDELYHLAAQSFVFLSFTNTQETYDTNIGGTLNIINAVREFSPKTRVYFAGSSEMFGRSNKSPYTEETPFCPESPYAISKVSGFWIMKKYRENYGIFAANGILFNHESEMRGKDFVTKKIALGVANISRGKQEFIELGNIDSKRDWGYAKDYVKGMWLMLQQKKASDYVIATGEAHSIRDFVEEAFKITGVKIKWRGSGVNEEGINEKTGKVIVKINPAFCRPVDSACVVGDYSKAKRDLGWEPKIKFKELVRIMVENELKQN